MITKYSYTYNIWRMASYKNVLLSSHLFWLHRQFFPQQVLHMCTALRGYNICHIYSMVIIVILLLLVRVSLTQIPLYVVQVCSIGFLLGHMQPKWRITIYFQICRKAGKYIQLHHMTSPQIKHFSLNVMKYIYIVYNNLLHQLDEL